MVPAGRRDDRLREMAARAPWPLVWPSRSYLFSEGASRARARVTPGSEEVPEPRLPKAEGPPAPRTGWCEMLSTCCAPVLLCWSRGADCFGFSGPAPRFLSHPHDSLPSFSESFWLPLDGRVLQQFPGDCQNGFPILHHFGLSVHRMNRLLHVFIYRHFL